MRFACDANARRSQASGCHAQHLPRLPTPRRYARRGASTLGSTMTKDWYLSDSKSALRLLKLVWDISFRIAATG